MKKYGDLSNILRQILQSSYRGSGTGVILRTPVCIENQMERLTDELSDNHTSAEISILLEKAIWNVISNATETPLNKSSTHHSCNLSQMASRLWFKPHIFVISPRFSVSVTRVISSYLNQGRETLPTQEFSVCPETYKTFVQH